MNKYTTYFLTLGLFFLFGCGGGGGAQEETPPNQAPYAYDQNYTIGVEQTLRLRLNVNDPEGDLLRLEIVSPPRKGSLEGTLEDLRYTPDQGAVGTDFFTFRVSDGQNLSALAQVNIVVSDATVSLSGKATYDFVPTDTDSIRLDFDRIQKKPIRFAEVDLLDANGNVIDSTQTDINGEYRFDNILSQSEYSVRIVCRSRNDEGAKWDVSVKNNTDKDQVYILYGALARIESSDQIRNLHAASGWSETANGYVSDESRAAAPFAILDTLIEATLKVSQVQPDIDFGTLEVFWSVKNTSDPFIDIKQGAIGTSYYVDRKLYLLGDVETDADEFDRHVIVHEWAHFYEDTLSRSDSIGGGHGQNDLLDIRVAFSEGWGNAFSAMVLDDPIYSDTLEKAGQSGFSVDIERGKSDTSGWYSEASVQRILYDLYDSENEPENKDTLSLSLRPIHEVMIQEQKQSVAFTSLFTFISALKEKISDRALQIDEMLQVENIAPINDIFGAGRQNRADLYPYKTLDANLSSTFSFDYRYSKETNKLGNRYYFRFKPEQSAEHNITLRQTNGNQSDPDWLLYESTDQLRLIKVSEGFGEGEESASVMLSQDKFYIIEVFDFDASSDATFSLQIF